jgi:hypothetical protein
MVEWPAMQKIAKRALGRQGSPTEEAVSAAMIAVYDAGKPITLQTVGQELDGRSRQPNLYAVNGSSALDPAKAEDMRRNPHKYR